MEDDNKLSFKFIWQPFIIWMLSLVLPIVLFGFSVYLQLVQVDVELSFTNFKANLSSRQDIKENVLRDINIWAIDNPSFENLEPLEEIIKKDIGDKFKLRYLVVARKGDEITPINTIEPEEMEHILNAFAALTLEDIPSFGEKDISLERAFIKKTGYELTNQVDFYYADRQEGSIYFFEERQVYWSVIISTLIENALLISLLLIIFSLIFSMYIFSKFTRPMKDLLEAVKKYKIRDFSARLNEKETNKVIHLINTSINDMAIELEETDAKNIRLEELRKEFIARISHDTKTPLASIKMHTEAVKEGLINDEEKRQKYYDSILNKVNILDHMITELSLYSNLETGINQYVFTSLDLSRYLDDMIEELQYEYADLEIVMSKQLQTPAIVDLDMSNFHRVVVNIFNNALLYGNKSPLEMYIHTHIEDTNVIITFRDNGQGTDIEDPNLLLDSFVRHDDARNPNVSGSGLGLAIVKTIVEAHGGNVSLDTEVNEYFEVCIKLPLKGD